jgi:hypothetical protein
MHARQDRSVAFRLDGNQGSGNHRRTRANPDRKAPTSAGSVTSRDDALDRALHNVWLGSIYGSRRFIWTGIAAAAGIFLTVWIALLWLMTWLLPAVF